MRAEVEAATDVVANEARRFYAVTRSVAATEASMAVSL
jgi:hypothetical protein